jgi:hypothetical protein
MHIHIRDCHEVISCLFASLYLCYHAGIDADAPAESECADESDPECVCVLIGGTEIREYYRYN